MMRSLIVFAVAALAAACGSVPADGGDIVVDAGSGSGAPPAQFNLTITTAGNGVVRGAGSDCRGRCSAPYASIASVHLVAVPDPGAVFTGWSGGCIGVASCDLTMDADRQVSATFVAAPPPPQGQNRLTVVVQGKGRVTSSPDGINCDSSTCTADFAAGTAVSLTASPGDGYKFDGWGTDCTGGGGCTVTLTKGATVYANFVAPPPPPPPPPPPAQVHLVAAVTGPGTVTGAGLNCGESTFTCDVTVASGTSVTLTEAPAGGTRFGSWGGACSGTASTCTLTVTGDTRVTAEFHSEVLVLAPNDSTNNWPIAINSTRLFWQRYVSGHSEIWSVNKMNGGDAVRVADGFVTALVADDSYLYWTDQQNLYSTPVGGGQVALLFSGSPIGKLALDDAGALYWTVGSNSGANSGSAHRMQNRADTVLAKGQNPSGSVAVDSTHLYFTDYGDGGSIRRVPRQGGAVQQIFYCGSGCFPQAIRLDSNNLYLRLGYNGIPQNGQVDVMSKSDFKVAVLNQDQDGSGGFMPSMDLDVNASVVYWNWSGSKAPYGIFRANADGSGKTAVDTSNDSSWLSLRVDDVALYYWHGGAVIRRLK